MEWGLTPETRKRWQQPASRTFAGHLKDFGAGRGKKNDNRRLFGLEHAVMAAPLRS
jgi:hypothetical protein